MACLCAPTSHEGSFRCRLHRGLNLTPNPAQSIPNHQIKGVNYCTNSINAISNQIICCNPDFTVRESSASASTAPHPFDDHVRFSHTPQVAADHLNSMRTRSSTSPSPSYTLSSTSPWSSSSYRSSATSQSSSSSRASASSSSSSPSSPFFCTRPPAGKRTSSPSKSPYRLSSSPSPSSWCGANGTTPSASHAAALAIMKQHSHNKHGARTHNRNILSPTSASKIGPSRLSRMAVACADELPLIKDEHCIANLPRHGTALDTFSGSFAETAAPAREFASFKAEPSIGLKTRSAVNKFKQNESSCRIVGSKGGALIMPTVY